MAKKRVIVSVINDLATDQRVSRSCSLLFEMGYEVWLIGRLLPHSPPLPSHPWKMHRMHLLFRRGAMFYAEFNFRLFLYLIFHPADLLLANDLDTLLPNYLIHVLRKTPLVYDSHEFFTETPEVIHRPLVRGVWLTIERNILPHLEMMITVNQSLAEIFHHKYRIHAVAVRNVPVIRRIDEKIDRASLGLSAEKDILILQGSGINIHRGAEELVASLKFLDNVLLFIVGGGDVIPKLKIMAKNLRVEDKIEFFNRMPAEELRKFTMVADIGLSIDKDICPNYHFSLPNKLFDYIHASLPILASPLPEIRKIIEHYQVGRIIHSHQPEILAHDIQDMLNDKDALAFYRHNCLKAKEELNWEKEKQILIPIYAKYLQ